MSRSTLRPTLRGIVALGTFGLVTASAVATDTPELAPLALAIGIPLVVSPVLARRRARFANTSVALHAHVEPGAVEVRTTMQVRLSVTNRSTAGAVVPSIALPSVEDEWRRSGSDAVASPPPRWVAPSVQTVRGLPQPAPGRTESCLFDVPTLRRGVFTLPPQRSWVHDPFGLVGAPGPMTPALTAVVHPVPHRVDHSAAAGSSSVTGSTSTWAVDSGPGDGLGELEGLRPYVPGDRLSLLHWPAKVRYGAWFVRQFDAEGTATVSVALDDRAGVHRRVEFERLVSATLWVVLETSRTSRAVHVTTLAGRSYSFAPDEQGRAEARLVLAGLQPVPPRTPGGLPVIPADVVVLTTRTGAERLVPRAPGAGSSHGSDDRFPSVAHPTRIVVV